MELRNICFASFAFLIFGCNLPETTTPPQNVVPEFTQVRYEAGILLGKGYADLSASLSSVNGVTETGFVIGRDEVDLAFFPAQLKDCDFSVRVDNLDNDTEYCFYAKAGNGRNEIRTRLVWFKTEAGGSSGTVPVEPDDPGGDDDPGGSDNPGGGEDPDSPDEPEPVPEEPSGPLMPPEGVGITISDQNFRTYLLGLCDANSDGKIVSDEADAVSSITVCTDNISTLDGIQYFRYLKTLDCSGSVGNGKLTSLALSGNISLETVRCNHNQIASISLPSSLTELECRFNKFSSLGLAGAPHLKRLDCYGDYLGELDLSALSELEYLVAGFNSFKTLDVSANLKLKYLDLYDSPDLEIVYVARGQRIAEFYVENNVKIEYKE
ncbi:MAG: leucine-rich repeat domain-containing protein [Candidatus Cryptobacteroides sp.]